MGSSIKGYLLIRERFLVLDQRHLEILSSGLQCLLSIRARASDPRIIFFGPAVPLHHSSVGASPSNYLLRASSASASFECGRQSLELSSSGRQRLYFTRVWAPVPRIIFLRPAAPLHYSSAGASPSNCLFRAGCASALLELWVLDPSIRIFRPSAFLFGLWSLKALFRAINALRSKYPNFGGNIPVWMSYVKYEGKSTVCNTRWPVIRIKRALLRNFPYLRYEVCTDGRIGCLTMN
jgi:hypothetical protein